ncbi:hypothetical protein [Streptomyces sp. KS_5]|uniref:hypothetical protein n=1 Tax=Streptomyces sp. KS_5 TaxID=1881018 RepID=UPI00089C7D76|nr:hypothetical protein [Streptomyces sp. KS_5]SEC54924.1 hypothetical protein SAMN05428938_2333 [Streptomyces sp. KS_5]
MADEQYRWLDRETAERLLRGESLEAVDAADRDQAERLAKTLEALTAEPPLTSAELSGEAAALAAFRAAREGRDGASATVGDGPGKTASEAADVGLVRLGSPARATRRPRWARPVRLGLAAALAVGMVGGIGVAAGTGVLPTPFDRNEPARPAATVSAPVPTENPLISPSPRSGDEEEPTPDGGSGPPSASGSPEDTVEPGGPAAGDRDSASQDGKKEPGGWWKAVTSYCRDVRDGRPLPVDRRRALEGAAGSSARVRKYCKSVLAGAGESTRSQRDGDEDEGDDKGHGRGDDDQDKDRGKGHGKGRGDGKGNGHGRDRGDDEDRSLGHRADRVTDSASRAASTVTRAYAAALPAASL